MYKDREAQREAERRYREKNKVLCRLRARINMRRYRDKKKNNSGGTIIKPDPKLVFFAELSKEIQDLMIGIANDYTAYLPNDCLISNKNMQTSGYCQIRLKNKWWLVHRIAFLVKNGAIDNALQVMHKCDNRQCCNPDHLVQGTALENCLDMHRKGRAVIKQRIDG